MDDTHAELFRDVARQNLADHILTWDRKQARDLWDPETHRMVPNASARLCQVNASHGLLQMHASGHQLMCCTTRPTVCEYMEPVSR